MSRLAIKDLFSDRIWSIDTAGLQRKGARFAVTFVKLIRLTVDTFAENRMGFQCVALSYFITLALIPLLAFIFAVTGGLGLSGYIDTIFEAVSANVDPVLLGILDDKAQNLIDIAKSGWVGVISAFSFLWTILWMMFQVERVFNNVWGIRKIPRKLYKRFGYYVLILCIFPFLFIVFGAGIAYAANLTKFIGFDISKLGLLPTITGYLIIYILSVLTLSAMYTMIPATKVKYRHAFNAAAVGALVFLAFQFLYLKTQVFVTRLDTVYGVLAAIPLFLIWLNFSWQIIIYGAELTYSFQNVKNFGLPEEDLQVNFRTQPWKQQ